MAIPIRIISSTFPPLAKPNNIPDMKRITTMNVIKYLLIGSAFLFLSFTTTQAQTIQGTFAVNVGPTYTYTYDAGYLITGVSWQCTCTVISSSSSGTQYSADVVWNAAGSTNIKIKSTQDGILDTRPVTVTSCAISSPSINDVSFSRCGNGPMTLQATAGSGGNTVRWYSALTGGTPLYTGLSYSLPTQSSSKTYYLETLDTGTGCFSTPRVGASTAINAIPANTPSIISAGTICGTGQVTMTASTSTGNVAWYNNDTSGSVNSETYLSLANTYAPTLSATTTFFLATFNPVTGCETAPVDRQPITGTVRPMPNVSVSTQAQTICSGQSALISITNPNALSGTTFNWTVAQPPGTGGSNGTGSTINQALVASTTPANVTYTITPTANGCTGSFITSTVTVNPYPVASASSNQIIPSGTGSSISITSTTPGTTFSWTASSSNGALSGFSSGSGSTISQTLVNSGAASYDVYYAITPSFGGCNGSQISRTVTVNPVPIIVAPRDSINSVRTTVFYKAGQTVAVSPSSLQPSDVIKNVVYTDGLGRTVQVVGVAQSPNNGDIILPTVPGKGGLADSTFLPYVATAAEGRFRYNAVRGTSSGTSYTTSEQFAFYQNGGTANAKVAKDANPYARAVFRNTPDARVIEQGAPGAAWQPGSTHTVRNQMTLATTSAYPVLFWKADGTTSGYYPDNTVWVSIITDENNHVTNIYKDKRGNTVLKQVQANASTWLLTYYIYDNFGQLIYQVPPKAMTTLGNGTSLNANNTSVAELVYKYTYDSVGQVVEKKVPGSALQYIVYDKLGRVVLTQDGNQRGQGVWAFVKYDFKNRPVYTGTYTSASTRTVLQKQFTNVNYNAQPWFETRAVNAAYLGYSNAVFPKTGLQLLTASYYDDYDFDFNGTADYTYDNTHLSGMPGTATSNTRGLATGNRKLILNTSNWITTCVFYDNLDRPIQMLSNNHLTLALSDKTSVLYFPNNLSTKVQKTKATHVGATTVNVTQRYTYDNGWRAAEIYHTVDNNAEQLVARYSYNALGQLVMKQLHKGSGATVTPDPLVGQPGVTYSDNIVASQYQGETAMVATNKITLSPGFGVASSFRGKIGYSTQTAAALNASSTFMQTVDYRYNIRGWMQSINNAQLTVDNGATNDDTNDYFGMELFYNTAENSGLGNSLMYNGNISAVKWKGSAGSAGAADQRSYKYTYDHSERLTAASFAAHSGSAWTKEVGTLDENITHDANGNIVNLTRYKNNRGLSGVSVNSTPQQIDNLTYTYATGNQLSKVDDASANTTGFADGSSATTEYTYDTHGNLTVDNNKGISNITYNVLGKAQQVTYGNGTTIVYTYDAAGTKLKTATTVSGSTTTSDYVGAFVYTNNALSFFSSPEGRIVKNGGNYEYQYAIGDHQGNTRVVFTSATQLEQIVTAGFETANQTSEASKFSNYPNGAHINPVTSNAHSGTNSLYLNGGYSGQIGVAKSYKVFPGDKVNIQAYAKYLTPTSTASNLAGFATALLGAFNLPAPAPGEMGTASSAINTWGGWEAGGYGDGSPDNVDPRVFVNIVIFDKNYKFLDVAYQQLVSNGALMSAAYTVKEAGYVYLYVSNEQQYQTDVYFDDVMMSYTPGNIIQSNEYYPFGLQTANSWTRDNTTGNNFLANGGTELNATSQVYDLDFRNYDPALGRLNQVDPLASKFGSLSPYHFSYNNPVGFTDPSGLQGSVAYGTYVPESSLNWIAGDQARNVGGAGTPRWDGSGGYFLDADGNGVQNGGERMMSYEEAKGYYGSSGFATYALASAYLPNGLFGKLYAEDGSYLISSPAYEKQWVLEQNREQTKVANQDIGLAVGVLETNYSVWESNYNHTTYTTTNGQTKPIYKADGSFRSARAAQFGFYSLSVKRVGFGLSTASTIFGGVQLYRETKSGQSINPVNAAQVGVGTIGLGASILNYFGLGGQAMGAVSATAGIFGTALSIPGNWFNVYKGAYEIQNSSTPYTPTDWELMTGKY
jgi:RHS repeat-associated protein